MRDIVEQIAKGLRAFHRKEMLHQDLRPDNIMIDATGTVKIIDFGSTRSRVAEAEPSGVRDDILGTLQYTAPEYFLGEAATSRSDMFSLGVITYQMLTGQLPYGAKRRRRGRARSSAGCNTAPAAHGSREIPALGRRRAGARGASQSPEAVRQPVGIPVRPAQAECELRQDLGSAPLIERNPLLFWKSTTVVLALAVVVLLALLHGGIANAPSS